MIVLIPLLWVLPIIIAPLIASSKGKSAGGWFIAAVFLGWFAVLAVALCESAEKTCPFCRERIEWDATSCPYCRREIPVVPVVRDKRLSEDGTKVWDKERKRWIAIENRVCSECGSPIKFGQDTCRICGNREAR